MITTGNGGDPPHQLDSLEERVGRLIPKVKIEGGLLMNVCHITTEF